MKKIFTKLALWVVFCILGVSAALAQNITVKGKVTENNMPLPGAGVTIKGTTTATVTDVNGDYTISVPGNGTLVFTSIGFTSREIPVNNQTTINVTLAESAQDLNQVVVVGYGTQQKRDVTGTIQSVKGEEIEKYAVTNPINALQGKVPGLTIANTGNPGSTGTVRIRGIASTNNANVLYVVDGVLQDNIDYLNPADIETIDVLKDASSTAIYALRGSNGVIAITTKRAAKGKSTINFQTNFGIQHVDKLIDVADAEGFKRLYSTALANTPGSVPFDFTNYTGNTNWQKEILRNAYINTNSLTISNSSEKSTTLVNLGYNDQDGVVKYNNFKKFTARLNQETRFNENFKMGGDITGYHFRNTPTAGSLNSAIWAAPIVPVRGENGLFNAMPSFQRAQVGNPLYAIERGNENSIDRGYRFTGSIFAELRFLKDFVWRSTGYTDLRFNNLRGYNPLPFAVNYLGEGANATTTFLDPTARTTVNQRAFERRMFQQDHTVTYTKTIKEDHRITALAGFTTVSQSSTNLEGSRTDSTLVVPSDPNLWYLNVVGRDNPSSLGGSGSLETQTGFFGRVSYAFQNKYLLNATVRRDASSKFAPANRWGTFGSVGLGWVASDESFFKDNIKGIDFLKFRAAWGKLGNSNAIPNNAYQQALVTGSSAVFGDFVYPSITTNYDPDPNLHWEVIRGLDFGMEVKALSNRLSAEVVYYDKKTTDLFTNVIRPSTGRNYYTNQGTVTNKGIETSVAWNDKIGSDFSYNISGNFSYVKNTVESIGTNSNFQLLGNGGINVTESGQPIAYFYGYKQVGIYQTTADLDRMPAFSTSLPGDIAYQDINGDGVITPADRTNLGTAFPPYSYGMTLSLTYKGFDASIDGQGFVGHKIYTQRRTADFAPINYEANRLNAWTSAGSTNVEPTIVSRGNNLLFSTYYLEDGDFFRIRNVNIGYTLPKSILAKAGIQKIRVFVSGQNIKTWSKVSGYSPEPILGDNVLSGGADNGRYPIPAIYSFGLNLSL